MAETEKARIPPLLMRLTMWAAAFYAFWSFALLALAASGYGIGINEGLALDSQLSLMLLGPLYFLRGCLLAGVSYSIYNHKPWSRHLVIGLWLLITLYAVIVGSVFDFLQSLMRREAIEAGVFGLLSAWYFYFKGNVVEYFDTLRQRK
jgi:hypothetical protein